MSAMRRVARRGVLRRSTPEPTTREVEGGDAEARADEEDEMWEISAVEDFGESDGARGAVDAMCGGSESALVCQNEALSALLDSLVKEKKQMEKSFEATLKALEDQNVSLRDAIDAREDVMAKRVDGEVAKLYAKVEKDVEKRMRAALAREERLQSGKLRNELSQTQNSARTKIEQASVIVKDFEKKFAKEVKQSAKALETSYVSALDSAEAKASAANDKSETLEKQIAMLHERVAAYDALSAANEKLKVDLIDKDEQILNLANRVDATEEEMIVAQRRANALKAKLKAVEESFQSKVQDRLRDAETKVQNAVMARKAAEARADEQERMSKQLISAAVIRAETAEAQLYRQNEILEEFAALNEAYTKSARHIVELQESLSAQDAQLKANEKALENSNKSLIEWRAKAKTLEEMTDLKVQASKARADSKESEIESKLALMKETTTAELEQARNVALIREKEISELKANLKSLQLSSRYTEESLHRQLALRDSLVDNLKQRVQTLEGDDDGRNALGELQSGKAGRLRANFTGPELRAFIAAGWKLDDERQSRWENGPLCEVVDEKEKTIKFDPAAELRFKDKLGTTGLRSARVVN